MRTTSKLYTGHSAPLGSSSAYSELRSRLIDSTDVEKSSKAIVELQQARLMKAENARSPGINKELPDGTLDLNSAFDLLDRATACFDLLSQRLDQAEAERDEAIAQIEEHHRVASQWQSMIETLKSRLVEAERDLSGMSDEIKAQTARADQAEGRASSAEAVAKDTERRAADLDAGCTELYHRIVSSFGKESSAYRVLDNLTQNSRQRAA